MTIGEKNKVRAAIGHPRIMGGQFINLNIINQSRSVENDINFIEYPRDPTGDEFFKGPETLGVDMLRIQNEFEPTVRIKTQSEDGMSAVPDYMVDDENPNIASVSRTNDDEEDLQFDAYNDPVHFGGTKIREDSEVVIGPSGTLQRGEDYALDPDRGMIQLLSGGDNHSGLEAEYTISYDFKNTPRNIAYMISKIPMMGGTSVYVYDVDDEFTGSESGRTYNVFLETIRHEMDPNMPQEAEITLEMRNAVLIDFDEI